METYIIDCETTGLESLVGIVEVGWCKLIQEEGDWTITDEFSSLVKSPYPISCGAGGLHGLRDEDLVDAPTIEEISFPQEEICLVCHNVGFDRPLLEPYLNVKEELCTMLLARRLLPGATDYKLPTLACFCDLSRQLAHRAPADVINTAELLIYMLQGTNWGLEQMLDFYKKPFVHNHMILGKHKGELMSDVPASYLAWLSKQDLDKDMRATVNFWLRKNLC